MELDVNKYKQLNLIMQNADESEAKILYGILASDSSALNETLTSDTADGRLLADRLAALVGELLARHSVATAAGQSHRDRLCTRYIATQLAKGHLTIDKLSEDSERIIAAYRVFEKHKRAYQWREMVVQLAPTVKPEDATNIHQFSNWRDLEDLTINYINNHVGDHQSNRQMLATIKGYGSRLIFTLDLNVTCYHCLGTGLVQNETCKLCDGGKEGIVQYNLRECTTPEALDLYGKGTRWCTSGWDSRWSTCDTYLKRGPLYILFVNARELNGRRHITPAGRQMAYMQFTADLRDVRDSADKSLNRVSPALDTVLAKFIPTIPKLYPTGEATTWLVASYTDDRMPIWEDQNNGIAKKTPIVTSNIIKLLANGLTELRRRKSGTYPGKLPVPEAEETPLTR